MGYSAGGGRFLNEIVWCYKSRPQSKRYFGWKHDVILSYSKSSSYYFNWERVARPLAKETISKYKLIDENHRRCRLQGRGVKGSPIRSAKDVKQHWETTHPELTVRDYLDNKVGVAREDWWHDIDIINQSSRERLGYPTQKPQALLERIIQASSKLGDVVLDPFCGCGTTAHAAQALSRRWIGIDICVTACQVIERRLSQHFEGLRTEFIGFPKTRDDAHQLADLDKFRFERWAASLIDGMEANKRQRGDKGIDGRGRLALRKGQFIDMVSQVKGGSTGPSDVQAFNGARQQAGAELGFFTCFDNRVTHAMRDAAVSTGRFMEAPRVQIYTIEDYFAGRRPILPAA